MELYTKNIKIAFSQRKFDSYFIKQKINQKELDIKKIKTILLEISRDFLSGKNSLDMWSGMAGKLYWLMVQQSLEKKDIKIFSILETISDLSFYLRQPKNNQTSQKLEEIYLYLDTVTV